MKFAPITRAGAKPNDAMHEIRDHSAHSTKKACLACGCPDCLDMHSALNPAPEFEGADDDTDRAQAAEIERGNAESITAILDRLQANGFLSSQQRQLAAASLAVRKMYNNKA